MPPPPLLISSVPRFGIVLFKAQFQTERVLRLALGLQALLHIDHRGGDVHVPEHLRDG